MQAQLRLDRKLHNRLIADAKTCTHTRLSDGLHAAIDKSLPITLTARTPGPCVTLGVVCENSGARRLRHIMSQTANWEISEGQRAYIEKQMAMHNRFVHNTVPGVDASPPQHALDMMAMRHKRPNLGDGSWLMRQAVKVPNDAHCNPNPNLKP